MLQRIPRTLLLGLISISFVCGQIDTLDAVSYLPMQIGNKWEYLVEPWGVDNYYFTVEIIDTVTMPNGYTYFQFSPWFLPNYTSNNTPFSEYARIDTSTLSVLLYINYDSCLAGEYYWGYLGVRDTTNTLISLFAESIDYPFPDCMSWETKFDSSYYIPELGMERAGIFVSYPLTVSS